VKIPQNIKLESVLELCDQFVIALVCNVVVDMVQVDLKLGGFRKKCIQAQTVNINRLIG